MRCTALPESPSRNVFTIGMAAPTAASKLSAPPCFSAKPASFTPCLASSALLAVTTDLPELSAASTARLAGSPAPPISSTKTSMPATRASSTGSENHWQPRKSTPRFLALLRAQTATISMRRPQRRPAPRAERDLREQGRADRAQSGDAYFEGSGHDAFENCQRAVASGTTL